MHNNISVYPPPAISHHIVMVGYWMGKIFPSIHTSLSCLVLLTDTILSSCAFPVATAFYPAY